MAMSMVIQIAIVIKMASLQLTKNQNRHTNINGRETEYGKSYVLRLGDHAKSAYYLCASQCDPQRLCYFFQRRRTWCSSENHKGGYWQRCSVGKICRRSGCCAILY